MRLLRASQLVASRAAGSRQSAFEAHETVYGVVSVSSAAEHATADDAQYGSVGACDGSDDAKP